MSAGRGSELELRRELIRLIEEGVSVAVAARQMGRSREWAHKWIRRYRETGEAGLVDLSRAPKNPPAGIDSESVAEVLAVRERLEKNPVASIGAETIYATMERDGWERIPSVASIERILKQAGVTRPYRKHARTGIKLPVPVVDAPGVCQQADWIQDRHLEGGIRWNSIQTVDVATWAMASDQFSTREVTNTCAFFLETAWPAISIPRAIIVDNGFVKTTHKNNPFTLFVRLCLFFGTEVLIAPPYSKGWTNQVESINNTWQERTVRTVRFATLEDLKAGSERAVHWLNHDRPILDPTIWKTRYPIEAIEHHAHQLRWPPAMTLADHQDHKGNIRIPLSSGRITFIRHTTRDHTIEIANNHWPTPETVPTGSLVIATITTENAVLTLRHDNQVISRYPYPIRHDITSPYHPPGKTGHLDNLDLSAMS